MPKRDYYDVLGVSKTASADEIKQAYRKLAMQHHPDRGGNAEKFKEISEAYAVLSEPQKRAQYDQYGPEGFSQQYSQEDIFRSAHFEDMADLFRDFGSGSPFEDMFGSFFRGGGGGGRRRKQYGADLEAETVVTLEEAAEGTKKSLDIFHTKYCERCHGSRAEPGSSQKTCSACNGRGQVQHSRRAGFMQFYTVTTCPSCHGEGKTIERPCSACKGRGAVGVKEAVRVHIPPGIEDSMHIRLEGMGEAGPDGAGDLYVRVHVQPHRVFRREGNDLHVDMPISFSQAALGDSIEVPTLSGKARLKIPAGTSSHTLFRLHEEGLPNLRSGRKGDEFVRVIIDVPQSLNPKQKKLLEEFDADFRQRKKGKKGFLDGFLAF